MGVVRSMAKSHLQLVPLLRLLHHVHLLLLLLHLFSGRADACCVLGLNCPVDGSWSSWSPWGECSQSCGNGLKTRTRKCVRTHDGKPCHGPADETKACFIESCPACTDEDGRGYNSGESRTCADGCNTCTCKCSREHGCAVHSTGMACQSGSTGDTTEASTGQYLCPDRTSIPWDKVCDGIADCLQTETTGGGEDEEGEECGSGGGNTEDPCSRLPGEVGLGRMYVQRWTFSEENGCYHFTFGGGGGGNANNFMTEEDCLRTCKPSNTEDPCSQLPGEVGLGRMYVQRWTFSEEKGCYHFTFGGGGGGNANNFMTEEDCLRTCKPNLLGPSFEDFDCPDDKPTMGTECGTPKDVTCSYGEEHCCGKTHASFIATCDVVWRGFKTDTCLNENCACNQVCSREKKPVCGSNGITYNNKCVLDMASCQFGVLGSQERITVAYEGKCKGSSGSTGIQFPDGSIGVIDPNESGCNKIVCSEEYKPVCGSNGITYNNKCVLDKAACQHGVWGSRAIRVAYEDKCKGSSGSTGIQFPDDSIEVIDPNESGSSGSSGIQFPSRWISG